MNGQKIGTRFSMAQMRSRTSEARTAAGQAVHAYVGAAAVLS